MFNRTAANKEGGQSYFMPLLNETTQYFARFRDDKNLSVSDRNKLAPRLRLIGNFNNSKSPYSTNTQKETIGDCETIGDKLEECRLMMQRESKYSLDSFCQELYYSRYNLTKVAEILETFTVKRGNPNYKHVFANLYQCSGFGKLVNTDNVGDYVDMDLARSGNMKMSNKGLVQGEAMISLIRGAVNIGVDIRFYYDKNFSMIGLKNIIDLMELIKSNSNLNKYMYRGKMTREEWLKFSKSDRGLIGQMLKKFFKVEPNFFKPSNVK